MAMIKQLTIQGVRSFSPSDIKGQRIEFGSPLTLILGVNGSGKTTIIETLKFAITSQFPPNSAKGASFVNDPKLSFSDQSLAKIQLDLIDAHGNTYTTTRKVKAVVKNYKGDLSMSQLEGTLRVNSVKGGSKQLTNKCSEMKFEMCRLMGVSEAILNYVIFCHQEESCWPLDEGKKVKETFDAIFNTTAYKKCFDRLTIIDKDMVTKIKVETEGLKYVKDNREEVIRFRDELEVKRIELQQQNERAQEYEKEIKEMEKKLIEFQKLENEYAKKQSEVAERRTKIETVGNHIEDLRKNIKEEFKGNISELKKCIKEFKNECEKKKTLANQKQVDFKEKKTEFEKLNKVQSSLLIEEGKFQQEENVNNKRLEELNKLLENIISAMKALQKEVPQDLLSTSFSAWLETCDSETSDASYEDVLKLLNSGLKMKDSELQNVKSVFDDEEADLQSAINSVRSKMAAIETEKEMKTEQLATNRKSLVDTKKRLKDLEGSNETLALLDADEEDYKEKIEEIENSGFMVKCDSEIKTLTFEIKSLESKVVKLADNINLLVADKSKTDQVAMLNRQKLQKQNERNEIMRTMEDELKTVLTEIPEERIGEALEAKVKALNSELSGNRSELRIKEKELDTSKYSLERAKDDLKKAESKLKSGRAKLATVLDDSDYDTVFTNVTEKLENVQSESSFSQSASYLYKQYIKKLNRKNCCPLCKRDFESQNLLKKLVAELESDVERMIQDAPTHQEELDRLKIQQQSVIKSKPVWDECQKLETEVIPELKTKMAELEEKIEGLVDETENLALIVSEIEVKKNSASKCNSIVAVYEQCTKELKRFDDQIAKVERSRDPEAKRLGATLTLQDAQTEQQELQESVRNKRSEKETKEDIKNKKRDELAKLQEKKNEVKEKKLKITAELQNREALETQKNELDASTKDLQTKITELDQSIPALRKDIAKAEKNKLSCIQRRENSLKKLRSDKDSLEKQKHELTEIQKRIIEFDKKKSKFADLKQRKTENNNEIAQCKNEMDEINKTIGSLQKEILSQKIRERELQDNFSLMEKREEICSLKLELKEKEKILIQAENHGLATERRELSRKHTQISAKYNSLLGSKVEIQKAIRQLTEDLARPKYANAEKDYMEKVVKKTVYEKALKDVRRYKTALDVAIMEFHRKRMEKINKILLEYWRRIYKGNDIDKISIKTEADKDPGADTKKKVKVTLGAVRKNYNYRVVMTRRGVDIDMRGRCSAGQRVLASIIIRIALAESFGARCGIISLDEPTTNLDQKNINSLADALSDLAEKMRSRRNFQLIIITHDQEFTQRLTCVDAVEHYWKVDRDREGFSQITMVRKRGFED